MLKILKRTHCERKPEKEEIPISWKCGVDHQAVNGSQSKNWIWSSNKVDSVLHQFWSSSLSICFKQAIHVPPFNVDGFETRNEKLVYNVFKKNEVLIPSSNWPESFTNHIQRPLYSTIVYWFFRKVKFMNNK